MISALEHDPEKWEAGFPKSMPAGSTQGIMFEQKAGAG
jgi:hypothetical protein